MYAFVSLDEVMYHNVPIYLVYSGTQSVCRFFHTFLQFLSGLIRVIIISGASFAALAIICSVPYSLLWNDPSVSLLPGVIFMPCVARNNVSILVSSVSSVRTVGFPWA